jgi:hypothetical protein
MLHGNVYISKASLLAQKAGEKATDGAHRNHPSGGPIHSRDLLDDLYESYGVYLISAELSGYEQTEEAPRSQGFNQCRRQLSTRIDFVTATADQRSQFLGFTDKRVFPELPLPEERRKNQKSRARWRSSVAINCFHERLAKGVPAGSRSARRPPNAWIVWVHF